MFSVLLHKLCEVKSYAASQALTKTCFDKPQSRSKS